MMLDPNSVPPIAENELLTRFVLDKTRIRADGTIKHHEFVAYKLRDLSVTRHTLATPTEIWAEGHEVARLRARALVARVEVSAVDCQIGGLIVVPDPLKADELRRLANPNHANVTGYPPDKPDQVSLAQKIAAKASKVIVPP